MEYRVYIDDVFHQKTNQKNILLKNLKPNKKYSITVSQITDGVESDKSAPCEFLTLGEVIIPKEVEVSEIKANTDSIGVEIDGLGTGEMFGGTEPENVDSFSVYVKDGKTVIVVPSDLDMASKESVLIELNKYFNTNKNKSIEIITK